MITWQTLRKSIDNKQFGKGICTSDDEKPVENIANGSELVEIDTGKRCVFDLGREEWIEYGTGETRTQKPGNVRTEVYEGLLSELLTVENIQKYGAALDAGAIGVAQFLDTTDEKMAEVKMGINYFPPASDDIYPGFFVFGAGTFGRTFADILEMSPSAWNRTFSDQGEYIDYVENNFSLDLGASIVVWVPKKSSVLGYFTYINTNGKPTIIDRNQIDNLGRFRFTFYYMDEGVEPSGGAKVTTETISGPLSTIFNDNGYTKEKFEELISDIYSGKASAAISIGIGTDRTIKAFMSPLVVGDEPRSLLLCTSSNTIADNRTLSVVFFWDEISIDCSMIFFSSSATGKWSSISDDQLSQMTGQSSYDLVITRIEEE